MSDRPTIFIAHSTLDLGDARAIRNMFEERDHDVLLFKLAQKMTSEFLNTILQQEIQARDWLVIVSSDHAERSSWVGVEKEFAQQHGKPIHHIELEPCRRLAGSARESCLAEQVARISRAIRIFISYSRDDRDLAQRLAGDLKRHGYEVWLDFEQLKGGELWSAAIENAIKQALTKGAVIALVSENYLRSKHAMTELMSALGGHGRVIPCLVDHPRHIPRELARYNMLDLSGSYEDGFRRLLTSLG